MKSLEIIVLMLVMLVAACGTGAWAASSALTTLFPTHLPNKQWVSFSAEGFSRPACGVIYHMRDRVTNGMALGGVDTGCMDLETSGLLGYSTLFNTVIPRLGPLNVPILGISVGGKTWVLCNKQPKQGAGSWQKPVEPVSTDLKLDGVQTASEINYWGHYPVADLEFETDAPVQVGLRAWSPFLPGDVVSSMIPGSVFEVYLRNPGAEPQKGTVAFSFPGPTPKEADSTEFVRKGVEGEFSGVEVSGKLASYALGVAGRENVRTGGELGADGPAWARIASALPEPLAGQSGSSAAVDFDLKPGETKVVRFVVAWSAPTWNAGGYNWAEPSTLQNLKWNQPLHIFTHMYSKYYPSAVRTAETLSKDHAALLKRVLAWQQVVYTDAKLPVWLRDSLVNILYMITEDGMWAQAKSPLPKWVDSNLGLFGMNECPRGCPQIECIPCSFYGNQPLVYFFPQLALSTLEGYRNYQYDDGAPPWIFGGCTGETPPIDFANPTRGYQFASNGISLASMVDRFLMCHDTPDHKYLKEFYPAVKKAMIWTVNLRPAYPIGDRIIAMPTGNVGTEWFEAPEPGWAGMTAHIGGLHIAQLRITERMAKDVGDTEFAKQCEEWIQAAQDSMEKQLWDPRGYYLNYYEPETGRKSELVFGYQLDGQWITDNEGLPRTLPDNRVKTVLETVKRCNVSVTKYGAVNYANPDATPAEVKGYGTYSYFPPEALMLAMTYMYEGQKEYGMELARKVWHNIVCLQGYTWDQPNIMRGDVDTGEATYGDDYYQNMMLWSLPAAMEDKDFAAPVKGGGLVDRVLRAANGTVPKWSEVTADNEKRGQSNDKG